MLVLLLGKSKAGKNTVANILSFIYKTYQVSPIKPLKNHLEETFGLPKNALEDYNYKNNLMPSGIVTYQKVLEKLYFFWQDNEPLYASLMLNKQIEEFYYSTIWDNQNLGLTSLIVMFSVRKPNEIDVIIKNKDKYNLPLLIYYITRDVNENVDTDEFLSQNVMKMLNYCKNTNNAFFYTIENNFNSIEELSLEIEKKTDKVLNKVSKYN